MSRISEERKESLLRRYGLKTINNNDVHGAVKPGGPGGMRPVGPGGRRPGGFGGPGARGIMSFGKPKNVSATIRRLLSYVGRDKIKILFAFACVLTSSLASLAGSYVLRPVINNLVSEELTAEQKIRKLAVGLLVMAGIYLVGVVCTYLQQKIMVVVSQNSLVKIRGELFSKVQKLPLKYHDAHPHGDIMSRFTNDLDSVGEMLSHTMVQIFSGILALIGTMVMMFVTNWILALVTIATTPLLV